MWRTPIFYETEIRSALTLLIFPGSIHPGNYRELNLLGHRKNSGEVLIDCLGLTDVAPI